MPVTEEIQAIDELMSGKEAILKQMREVIVGQESAIDQILMAFFAGGHCLLEGVPGLAKTLIIKTIVKIYQILINL